MHNLLADVAMLVALIVATLVISFRSLRVSMIIAAVGGLSIGLGMALASRMQDRRYRVVAVLSDGECNEGTVWEAAMFAAAQRLDNVTVIVDFNRWQATDRSEQVMAISPLVDKWQAFGWSAVEVDGHDIEALANLMNAAPGVAGKPTAIIARTTKGKGVSFMEDDNNWHYRIPNDEELRAALDELGVAVDA